MGKEAEIIRLECEVIRDSHFRALTYDQWADYYAEKYRAIVNDVLKRTGKLPTKEKVIMDLSA